MKPPLATLIFLSVCFQKMADAQTAEPFLESTRSLGLATATTALPGEPGMTSNPASLAFFEPTLAKKGKKPVIAATAATPYFIKNWKKLTLASAIPMGQSGHFALAIARSGIPELVQSNFRIGYGRQLTPKIGAGLTASFSTINAGEYGRTTGISAGLGLLWRPKDPFRIGFSIQNPTATGWKTGDERSPIFRMGAMYQLNPLVLVAAEMEKMLGAPPVLKGGLEYSILKKVVIRSGIRSGPFRWAFGGSLPARDGIWVDFGADWQPVLGVTPGVTVGWKG